MDEYPELQAAFSRGIITEVHPERPKELWREVCTNLPNENPFSSFLVVPIKSESEFQGFFFLRDRDPDRNFDQEEQDFCQVAASTSAAFLRDRELLEELQRRSRIDGLTGLLNFEAFQAELDDCVKQRAEDDEALSLVVVDMDNLKPINDQHGHLAGNRAIIELGNQMRRALPRAIAMCRYGGDEFVALVPGAKSKIAKQVKDLLGQLADLKWDAPFQLRASCGIAQYPEDGADPALLTEAADQAMYVAKGAGGQRLRLASPAITEEKVAEARDAVRNRRHKPSSADPFDKRLNALREVASQGLRSEAVRKAVTALMQEAETKIPQALEQSMTVGELCGELAAHMELSVEEALEIETAGRLHDLGKVRIAREILNKRGGLNDSERKKIERVPIEGARMLEGSPPLAGVAELILKHQERWNGGGYPHGLRAEEISLGAQILGICNVYEALTSNRPHRGAIDRHRALRIIEQEIGNYWNPRVARAFLEMLAKRGPAPSASTTDAETTPNVRVVGGRRKHA